MTERWNHNIHYGRQLIRLVPVGACDALDVGCGEGWLVRELRQWVPHVVGIDADEFCIATASASDTQDGIEYRHGDFLTFPFEPASFDIVTAVASLHHLDEEAALGHMAQLLRPGGVLGVVGIARTRSLQDLAFDIAGVAATRVHKLNKGYWESPGPKVWPPPHSYGQLRRLTEPALPGRQFWRGAMFRYLLTWSKPKD
jgi:2-polyprenyl-3-methyl-5-hydroxy-6-metoxy-1,4-benzoquinol methylase